MNLFLLFYSLTPRNGNRCRFEVLLLQLPRDRQLRHELRSQRTDRYGGEADAAGLHDHPVGDPQAEHHRQARLQEDDHLK